MAEVLSQPTLLRFLSLDRLSPLLERHARLLAGAGSPEPHTLQCVTASGTPFWAEVSETLIDWQGERAVAVTVMASGDRARTRRTEALLREAIDTLSDSFVLYDADDRAVLTNKRFHEIFPFLTPQDAVTGARMVDLVRAGVDHGMFAAPASEDGDPEAWIAELIEKRRSPELRLREDAWPDGRWDLVREKRLASGGFVSVRTDITDRKRAELALKSHEIELGEALAERTRHLEAVLANVAQGVIVLSPDLRVVLTNQGLHDLVGYPKELGKPGTHVSELIRDRLEHDLYLPGEDRDGADRETLIQQRLDAYQSLTREAYRHVFPNGRLIEIRREKLSDGTIVCTFMDVTEQANAEQELQRQREALYQREKLSALGMLLAGVAHELNNPLSVVLGQASLMESYGVDDTQKERARRIHHAADRCAKIIKTFLAMARDEPASRTAVQLNDLVEQSIDLMDYQFRRSDTQVITRLADDLPVVIGDPDQLNQVVVNLIINALQALEGTVEPRRITVRTEHLAAKDADKEEIELVVTDTGPGVPEELRGRIFDPFFTTKPTGIGVGVGLSVCHGMVTAHAGTISVEPAPGGGAQFRVRLPCGPAGREETTVDPKASSETSGGRVLIIDDEPEICEVISEFLRSTGAEIAVAKNGRDGLQYLDESAGGGNYDVVVCDLRMPDMDGPALFAEVGRRWPHLLRRFIFVTGDLLSAASREFLDTCGRPYLEKPFLPDQVRRIVAAVMDRSA